MEVMVAPTSAAQRRIWFVEQLSPGTPTYHVAIALHLRGHIDPVWITQAFNEILSRHDALRTTFSPGTAVGFDSPDPVQLIHPFQELRIDAQALDAASLPEALRLEVARTFDLQRGPLYRPALFRLDVDHHVLLLTLHHLVCDGWSMAVLQREFAACFQALARGTEPVLEPLEIQYADYAEWEEERLASETLTPELTAWQERLSGRLPVLALPTDFRSARRTSGRGGLEWSFLPESQLEPLRALARREGCTEFMALLAVYATLLHRCTHQDELIIGTPTANRLQRELEPLIGCFVNALALRVPVEGKQSFRHLLERVREQCLFAFSHAELPFDRLVEGLEVGRDGSRTPVFQTVFVLQTAQPAKVTLPGLEVEVIDVPTGTAKFDLTLTLEARPGGLQARWEYRSDLLDPRTVQQFSRLFGRLLDAVTQAPDRPIELHPLLSSDERAGLVRLAGPERRFDGEDAGGLVHAGVKTRSAPNVARGLVPRECRRNAGDEPPRYIDGFLRHRALEPLHQIFQEVAAAHSQSEAVCIVEGDTRRSLTYREIEQASNRLAWRLLAAGVGPEVRVGLCAPRSLELVVGILAILKAGGAYVPLDPDYPAERLEYVLKDSRPGAVLVAAGVRAHLPVVEGLVYITLEPVTIEQESPADPTSDPRDATELEPPPSEVQAENAAYVIYTSGSTGQPKGVVVTHANVARLMRATEAFFDFGPADVWTLFHSFAFDFSVWELWGALLYGGKLVVVPWAVSRDPAHFYRLLIDEKVTVLNQTPSSFRALIAVDDVHAASLALRYVIFGGEALDPAMLASWIRRRGDSSPALINMYGITETTVHVTWRQMRREDALERPASLIGRPIPDLELHVLDARLEPVPVGVAGELFVGGAGVARGYLDRPELTAARFLDNPFADGKLYRTGDLARRTWEGDLEYLGRIDHQVKLRGFRIELGEIEATLCAAPGVREAVVKLVARARPAEGVATAADRDDRSEDDVWMLGAWLVPSRPVEGLEAQQQLLTGVRAHLAAQLPAYMIPSSFMILDRLPLTHNGKLDRDGLPPLEPEHVSMGGYEPPASEVEAQLASIWASVLGMERVGRRDNFFALGGDSILSLQVVARAAAQGLTLSVAQLFEHQTVSALAEALAQVGTEVTGTHSNGHLELQAEGSRSPDESAQLESIRLEHPDVVDAYPLSPLQAGMLFQSLYAPESGLYIEQIVVTLEGALDPDRFERAWASSMSRHDALRASIHWLEWEEPLQYIHTNVRIPLTVLDWRAQDDEAQRQAFEGLIDADRGRGFSLERAPLMRLTLIRLQEKVWRCIWTHHHLLLDGWSIPLVFRDVLAAYDAQGSSGEMPPAPSYRQSSYRQYIDHTRAQLSQAPAVARPFWRELLRGVDQGSTLPFPRPVEGDTGRTAKGSGLEVSGASRVLSVESTRRLEQAARDMHITLNTLTLGAFALLLHHSGASSPQVIGTTVSGRSAPVPGIDQLVGLFINTLPLRVDVVRNTPVQQWLEQLQQVQARMRGFEHSRLVDIHECSGLPPGEAFFEALFVFENYPVDSSLREGGSSLQAREVRYLERSPYPLTAAVVPGAAMTLRFDFDPSRLSRATAGRLLEAWQTLLESLAAQPERPLGDVTWQDPSAVEALAVLTAGQTAGAQAPLPLESLTELFNAQVERTPSSPALMCGDTSWTYQALAERSDALAASLRARGLAPEQRVAIQLERSDTLVVAMLGVLKAGGCFLPLDPQHSRHRTDRILEEAGAVFTIGEGLSIERIDATNRRAIGRADVPSACRSLGGRDVRPTGHLPGESLAYIIFTSGSTGKPKGVEVTHRGVCNLVRAQGFAWEVGPGTRALQFASPAFDACISEVFVALCHGATLTLDPDIAGLAPAELEHRLTGWGITLATLPPALLQVLDPARLPLLRTLVMAGEAAPEGLYRQWASGRRVFNAYGPTECSVCVTMEEIDPHRPINIGRSLENVYVRVLNPDFQPVPPGVAGELYVGGVGLARGYSGQPGLTAERFVPDPLSREPGARLYRTGDRVSVLEDGRLLFHGRTDHQLKIRGHRIEPGEIEATLAAHPQVAGALVTALPGPAGAQRLTAYVVKKGSTALEPSLLLAYLSERLPGYMVPAAVVPLDAWPLNASGKIDRRALPLPETPGGDMRPDFTFPLTGVEQALTLIWSQVLHIDLVSVTDNFFALGGDSILSLQVISRAYQDGLELSPRDLFLHPTIRELAQVVRRIEPPHLARLAGEGGTGRLEQTSALHSETASRPDVPLTPIQHWFFEQQQPEPHHFNQALLLEVTGRFEPRRLEQAIAHVCEHLDGLRLRFEQKDGEWRQFYGVAADSVGFHTITLDGLTMPESQRHLQLELEKLQRSLDLKKGPVGQVAWYRDPASDDGSLRLCLIFHHLVIDGVSWRIFLDALMTAYQQLEADRVPNRAPNAVSYGAWSRALTRFAGYPELGIELPYWLDSTGDPALPLDHPLTPEALDAEHLCLHTSVLDAKSTSSLLREGEHRAGRQNAALEALLTALAWTISRWSGGDSLYVNLEGHGRERFDGAPDISMTLGWFTTLYPVCLRLEPWISLEQAIPHIGDQLAAIPRKGLGYGVLRYLHPDLEVRSKLARIPAPWLSFNYLGQTGGERGGMSRGGEAGTSFRLLDDALGATQSPRTRRAHLLDISAMVVGDTLRVRWIYSRRAHRPETIERLAADYLETLKRLLAARTSGRVLEAERVAEPAPSPSVPVQDSYGLDTMLELSADDLEALYGELDL